MSINQFTLNNLYSQGILDYVPYDLCGGANVSTLQGMQNPYLSSAMQGNLYQTSGTLTDSFTSSIAFGGINGNVGFNNPQAGMNGFGVQGIGVNSNAGMNGFGMSGIGTQSNAGMNGFGMTGVGTQSNAGMNGFGGGFGKLGQNTAAFISGIPNTVKGLISAGLIIGTTVFCLKGKKKPPVEKTGFWSKLNPKNWVGKKVKK